MKPKRIAVISGGSSAEAEISRVSGAKVEEALSVHFPTLAQFELDHSLTSKLQNFNPDVVVPMLHGPPGEDGTIQGYLETLGYPYVGSDHSSSAYAMNKIVAKQLFQLAGLPVAKDIVLSQNSLGRPQDLLQRVSRELGEKVVVKPINQGSAVGVIRTHLSAMDAVLEEAFKSNSAVLLEQFIDGREITAGVLEKIGAEPEVLPITEVITPANTWYDYQHRYAPDGAKHVIPAALPKGLSRALQQATLQAHQALACRDLSRSDFIVTKTNDFYLLETNTLPGMTPTSLYPDAASKAGYGLPALMAIFVNNAWQRHYPNPQIETPKT